MGGGKVCQKNTSTLLLECTKIFKSSIFISLFHTLDVRMDIHTNGSMGYNKRLEVTCCSVQYTKGVEAKKETPR